MFLVKAVRRRDRGMRPRVRFLFANEDLVLVVPCQILMYQTTRALHTVVTLGAIKVWTLTLG